MFPFKLQSLFLPQNFHQLQLDSEIIYLCTYTYLLLSFLVLPYNLFCALQSLGRKQNWVNKIHFPGKNLEFKIQLNEIVSVIFAFILRFLDFPQFFWHVFDDLKILLDQIQSSKAENKLVLGHFLQPIFAGTVSPWRIWLQTVQILDQCSFLFGPKLFKQCRFMQ